MSGASTDSAALSNAVDQPAQPDGRRRCRRPPTRSAVAAATWARRRRPGSRSSGSTTSGRGALGLLPAGLLGQHRRRQRGGVGRPRGRPRRRPTPASVPCVAATALPRDLDRVAGTLDALAGLGPVVAEEQVVAGVVLVGRQRAVGAGVELDLAEALDRPRSSPPGRGRRRRRPPRRASAPNSEAGHRGEAEGVGARLVLLAGCGRRRPRCTRWRSRVRSSGRANTVLVPIAPFHAARHRVEELRHRVGHLVAVGGPLRVEVEVLRPPARRWARRGWRRP